MAVVTVTKNTYTVDPLYQWDLNQVLEIRGLSMATVPEVHFTNDATARAVRRFATMDAAGVIRAEVPNGLLQASLKIRAHVCTREGELFKTWYTIEIPVKARKQPADYTITDDQDIYSFMELENLVRDSMLNASASADRASAQAAAAAASAASAVATAEAAKATADGVAGTAANALTTANEAKTQAAAAQQAAGAAVSQSVAVVLTAAAWANNAQTVSVAGVTAGNTVFVSPEPGADNYAAYTENGLRCTEQAAGALTFVCESAPSTDVTVNVTVLNR